jgi:hypothetical protein
MPRTVGLALLVLVPKKRCRGFATALRLFTGYPRLIRRDISVTTVAVQ